ncbi:MAG: serine--tRNA ligase, partial [Hyphomicrobiales bacterium]|nr:serine--tRNA ligase [Hyphomicrobiales bacterium]
MHDIRLIREHPDEFDRGLARRGLPPAAPELLALDEARRTAIQQFETAQARRNAASREIGEAKKAKDEARAQTLIAEVAQLKTSIPELESAAKAKSDQLDAALAQLPNTPLPEVPDGKDADDNVEHHRFGAKRDYGFTPKEHFDLGEALGEMDFATAAKLSGSRFVVVKNHLARLQRALGQFMLDVHTGEHRYTEVAPPLLVRDHTMFGTAQLPKFEQDQFVAYAGSGFAESVQLMEIKFAEALRQWSVKEPTASQFGIAQVLLDSEYLKDRLWLIPTAEVSLTNLVREQILDADALPLRFTALTPCFRAEAGAAGKDTRGMLRQHQFDKVELVSITTPETSRDEHERMLSCAEEILRRLDLHYRVVTLCTGDMGFASQKTYDIEVWLPGQGTYREISSCSVCGEFQARRMDARYRSKADRSVRHVHTLNGSGVAVGRA